MSVTGSDTAATPLIIEGSFGRPGPSARMSGVRTTAGVRSGARPGQAVLHRERRGAGARAAVDLQVDVGDVVLDGARREHEPRRDLLVVARGQRGERRERPPARQDALRVVRAQANALPLGGPERAGPVPDAVR